MHLGIGTIAYLIHVMQDQAYSRGCYRMGLSDHRSTERSYSCYMYFQLVTFNIKTIMMISNDEYGANRKCVEL